MNRIRLSTTVDAALLDSARSIHRGTTDARLVDDAPSRGEVWWCEPAEVGRRPVVVLSRDAAIPQHRRALVAPCTTTLRSLASEVPLEPAEDPCPYGRP